MTEPGLAGLGGRTAIAVVCPCGEPFEAPRSMRGGLANCPRCGVAVSVPGSSDGWFWLMVAGGAVVVCGCAGLVGFLGGPVAGLITLAVGGTILGIAVLAF